MVSDSLEPELVSDSLEPEFITCKKKQYKNLMIKTLTAMKQNRQTLKSAGS